MTAGGCVNDSGSASQSAIQGESPPTEQGAADPDLTTHASTSTATAVPTTVIDWEQLPPVNAPAGLVAESYDGSFLALSTVIDSGDGPRICGPAIADSDPPQCNGVPIEGWDWSNVAHDAQAGSRWGEYVVIGRWTGSTFVLTRPSHPIDWSQIRTLEQDDTPKEVPCPTPDGGWWSDTTDPERVGSVDYNAAIDVVTTRPEFVSVDVVPPEEPRPAGIAFDPTDVGWEPGVLVVRMTEVADGDEEAIRADWGGPVCLVVADASEPSVDELAQLEADVVDLWDSIAPGESLLAIGHVEGRVRVRVWVATIEAQARLDEQFGPESVELIGVFWPAD